MTASNLRQCGNCERTIGKLEQLVAWKGHLVCEPCRAALSGASRAAGGQPQRQGGAVEGLAEAVSTHVISPKNVQQLKAGIVALVLVPLVLILLLVIVAAIAANT